VQTLLTAFFVLGLGCGPFLFAPTAELYGRQSAYISSTVPYALLNAACIVAPRFVAGLCLPGADRR
jgi:DHA1 family multidrug resistance protein-like MFS transporter